MCPSALEVVKSFYADLGKSVLADGRVDPSTLHLMHPDVKSITASSLPYGGIAVGREGYAESVRSLQEYWVPIDGFDTIYLDADPVVIVRSRGVVRAVSTGLTFNMESANWWTVKDGQIVEVYHYYFDTYGLMQAICPPETKND